MLFPMRHAVQVYGILLLVFLLLVALFVRQDVGQQLTGAFLGLDALQFLIQNEVLYGMCDEEFGSDFARTINVPYYGCGANHCEEAAYDTVLRGNVLVSFHCEPEERDLFIEACTKEFERLCQ